MSKRYVIETRDWRGEPYWCVRDKTLVEIVGGPALKFSSNIVVHEPVAFAFQAHAAAFAAALNLGDEALKKEADRES